MYNHIFYAFLYLNLQFIFDYLSKSRQIVFIESLQDNIDINSFIMFNLLSLITTFLQLTNNYVRKIYLENPIKNKMTLSILKKTTQLPPHWIEQNSHNKLKALVDSVPNIIYNKYTSFFELYGSIIRVLLNSFILYNIYSPFLLILFPYFLMYFLFYNKIILHNRTIDKSDNKVIYEYGLKNTNLFINYYNSFLGNYQEHYKQVIYDCINYINTYRVRFVKRDIIYRGTLQIFHKLLLILLLSVYMINNCSTKCAVYLLPLYQTTVTLVYQFEYILHNMQGLYNAENQLVNYYEFKDYCKKNIKYSVSQIHLPVNFKYIFDINYKLNTDDNRNTLYFNTKITLKSNSRILIKGITGIGKSTICKIISGHFNDFPSNIAESVLYISQNTLINLKERTLLNVISHNDYNLFHEDINLITYICKNIIPFKDIISSFNNELIENNKWLYEKLDDNIFSGGQNKRIYLCMWLYYLIKNISTYKILILDEADKGLDNNTYNNLLKNIFDYDLFKNLCIIVISHNDNNDSLFSEYITVKKNNNTITIN